MARTARVLGQTLASVLTTSALSLTGPAASAGAAPPVGAGDGRTASGDVRRMVYVGNNWAGTADLVAPGSFERKARLDVVPDRDERMAEILASPDRLAYFLAVREAIGEGHDQLVDDMYSTHDGRTLYRLPPELRRRGRDQPEDPEDRLAVRGRRLPLRPHGDLAGRAPGRGQRQHRGRRARAAHHRRQGDGALRERRLTARERLHRRRPQDPPCEHRHGLQPPRPRGGRRHQAGTGLPDRRREDVPDPAPDQCPQGARRPRPDPG